MIASRYLLACGTACIALCLPASGVEPGGPRPVLGGPTLPPVLTGGFADHIQPVQGGKLDWANGYLLAEGIGKALDSTPQQKALAERAAEMAAGRNALAIAQGIYIDANGRVGDLRDGLVRIQGVLQAHEVTKTEWPASLQCKVTLRVPMWGLRGLGSAVLPFHQAHAAGRRAPRLLLTSREVDVSDFVLVIDARGHQVTPCLFAALLGKNGQVIYDSASLPASLAGRVPPVRYVETRERFEQLQSRLEGTEEYRLAQYNPTSQADKAAGPTATAPATQAADADRRRAKRRMAVKVAETTGQNKTQLVLSQEDAERLKKSPEAAAAVRNAQVLVVVDAAAAGFEGRGPDAFEHYLAIAWPSP